ncbi:MAG: hypothetical protein J7559_05650, partial [Cohnella sp.]|nr:hypothetical protein [Cohnella sp.]
MSSLKETADKLNAKSQEANPDTPPAPVVLTLDLGNVDAAEAEISLPDDFIEAAKASGVDSVAVTVNGVSVTISLSDYQPGTTVK